jgi:ankyrin repeat protein
MVVSQLVVAVLRATVALAGVNEDFSNAAWRSDLPAIKRLISNGADVNTKDGNGYTPLHWAASNGHREVVEFLLACKADVNAKSNSGDTPLHVAAAKGYKPEVELLLGNQADVNVKDNKGYAPLHYAVLGRQRDVVELLLEKHAEVNARDSNGKTPLYWAAAKGYKDIAELLRLHGGQDSMTVANSAVGLPTIHNAARNGDVEKVKMFLKANPTLAFSRDETGMTPLHWAASFAQKNMAQLLLANKAQVNAQDSKGVTPLHLAAANGNKDMLELLLFNGAEVNAKDNKGHTPLYYATQLGASHKDAAELLLQRDSHSTDRAQADKMWTPPANWPGYSGELKGSHEVRVRNPNEFNVCVGLRSDGKGKDFIVSPNGMKYVNVPNGHYDIYFNYSSDPDGLYQGDSFTLANNGVEITITKVINGNYGIRKVK